MSQECATMIFDCQALTGKSFPSLKGVVHCLCVLVKVALHFTVSHECAPFGAVLYKGKERGGWQLSQHLLIASMNVPESRSFASPVTGLPRDDAWWRCSRQPQQPPPRVSLEWRDRTRKKLTPEMYPCCAEE